MFCTYAKYTKPFLILRGEAMESVITTISTAKGAINVIHEITLGDLLVTMSIVATLIFNVLSRVIRRD
jgi:hypothetical protein